MKKKNNVVVFKVKNKGNKLIKTHARKTSISKKEDIKTNLKNGFFIEGGGTKGVFAIGVLKYLFEKNPYFKIEDIDIFGGTSVGSYFAAALSFGYQKDDILEISKRVDLSKLTDGKFMFLWTFLKFVTKGYMYDEGGRLEIIKQILNYKINVIKEHLKIANTEVFTCENMTFGHLRKLINEYPQIYKHLLINTVDLSRSKQIFMTTMEDKWDDIHIVDALLASSAIPGVFKPKHFYYNEKTDSYCCEQRPDSTIDDMIDGGTDSNNPLDFFLTKNNSGTIDYKIWLLKFIKTPVYVNISGIKETFEHLVDYLLNGKNRIIMELLEDKYDINTINLHLSEGTLEIYSQEEIQKIIEDTYNKCKDGEYRFFNDNDD